MAINIPAAVIICVNDGLQAYKIYETRKIDLILSDWNMPLISGEELLVQIRGTHNVQLTPFLM